MKRYTMTRSMLASRIDALTQELEFHTGINPACNNCIHFEGGICLMWELKPPSDVVATGCDDWEFDCIPF